VEVPLAGVDGEGLLPFPIYLRPDPGREPVLFAESGTRLGEARLERLQASGVSTFLVPPAYLDGYYRFLEERLGENILDTRVPLEERCGLLRIVVVHAAESLLKTRPDQERLERVLSILDSTVDLAWKEPGALPLLRRMVEGNPTLAGHCVAVSLYAMGTGFQLFPGDRVRIGRLAWAAFLHDVGRAPAAPGKAPLPSGTILGNEEEETPDYSHALAGEELLFDLGMPEEVARAAGEHHERMDGSGAPRGLDAGEIHPFARVTALANVFDHIRSSHRGFLGIFESFRILIRSFPGCFDPVMVEAFLKTFGPKSGRKG